MPPRETRGARRRGTRPGVPRIAGREKLRGRAFTAVSAYFTIVIFLASGLALLLFRDSVIPLAPRTRRLVLAAVALTGLFLIALQLVFGRNAPKPLQFAPLGAFVVVWSGCVGEP